MMQEFWERGVKAVIPDVIAAAKARASKVYISIDIDVLDSGFAPAYDHADITVNNAHRLIGEAFGAMAAKKRAAGLTANP